MSTMRPDIVLFKTFQISRTKWRLSKFYSFAILILMVLPVAGVFVRHFTHKNVPSVPNSLIFDGISYERDAITEPRPIVIHYVTVDLGTVGLQFLVAPPLKPKSELPLRAETTSAFLKQSGTQVAVNGDFFFPYHPEDHEEAGVEGDASSRGVSYGCDETRWERPALCLSRTNRASIRKMRRGEPVPYNAIGGDRFLLQEERVTAAAILDQRLNPRTAVALNQVGTRLIIAVADGRQSGYSEGVTLEEMAHLLQSKGGCVALNFDGGGSSTLVAQGDDGSPKVLNSPVDYLTVGAERPIANHLAVFANRVDRRASTNALHVALSTH